MGGPTLYNRVCKLQFCVHMAVFMYMYSHHGLSYTHHVVLVLARCLECSTILCNLVVYVLQSIH